MTSETDTAGFQTASYLPSAANQPNRHASAKPKELCKFGNVV
ncbi:hypothetical protein [Neisseria cinerea]